MAKDFATASLFQLEGLWEVVELPMVVRSRGRVAVVPGRGVALWGRGAGLAIGGLLLLSTAGGTWAGGAWAAESRAEGEWQGRVLSEGSARWLWWGLVPSRTLVSHGALGWGWLQISSWVCWQRTGCLDAV